MPVILKCNTCGITYQVPPTRSLKSHFCSQNCYNIAQRSKVELKCTVCGEKYQVFQCRAKKSYYCSQKCFHIIRNHKIEIICLICKKSFQDYASSKRRYCSLKCSHIAREKEKILHTCEMCGKEFTHKPSINPKYCSKNCNIRSQVRQVSCVCESCGKTFTRLPCQIKNNPNRFCCQACYMKGGLFIKSSLEKKLELVFPGQIQYVGDGKLRVVFQNGRCKYPDFVLKYKNGKFSKKIIEAHGDFWHRTKIYNNGQDLINQYAGVGYDCLIIWESEVKNNIESILTKIANFTNIDNWQLKLF